MKRYLTILILILLSLGICVSEAFALLYTGGSGDGFGYSVGATDDLATISSAADQMFAVGDSATAISIITIEMEVGQSGAGINTTDDIRVKIPASLYMVWDSTDTTAVISGNASAKVSATVSYEDSDATLVIDVTTNFDNNDSIVISGLSFKNFNSASLSNNNLDLEIDNLGTNIASDDKDITISGTYLGGSGDGFSAQPNFEDCGLRFYNGTNVIRVACEPQGALTSALRIRKGSVTYGIVLVDPADTKASVIRINTTGGTKSVRKF